jgi:hypothetical protein
MNNDSEDAVLNESVTALEDNITTNVEDTKQEPTLSSDEQLALSKGWKPLDQFKGDQSEWKGAKAFLKDGEKFESLMNQQKEIKKLQSVVSRLLDTQSKIEETTRERLTKELKAELKAASAIGDSERAAEIAERLLETSRPIEVPTDTAVPLTPEEERQVDYWNTFAVDNPWVLGEEEQDIAKRNVLFAVEAKFTAAQRNLPKAQYLALLDYKLKEKLATTDNRPRASAVETDGHRAGDVSDVKYLYNKLPQVDKEIVNMLKKQPGYNDDVLRKYYNNLKEIGEIK